MYDNTAAELTELREASAELREQLGVFTTEEELEAYAFTSPIEALKKCLGLKSLAVSPDIKRKDDRIVAQRKAAWRFR